MEQFSQLERFYLNNCRNIFNKFLEKNIGLCDVTLMGQDGTCVKCHRFVLSACSPFFNRTFENYTKSKVDDDKRELVILLTTYKSKNVQRMVDYIYYGKLPVHLGSDSDKDMEEFIRLAIELEVFGLHELLLKQQKRNRIDETHEHTESEENVTNCVADNNDIEKLDIEPETEKKRSPEELLKSSPKYNNWLNRLSNVRERLAAKNQSLQDKNPQELIKDIIDGVKYCFYWNYTNGEHECLAIVEGQCFSGNGITKQAARLQTIKTILQSLFNITLDQTTTPDIPRLPTVTSGDKLHQIPMKRALCDRIETDVVHTPKEFTISEPETKIAKSAPDSPNHSVSLYERCTSCGDKNQFTVKMPVVKIQARRPPRISHSTRFRHIVYQPRRQSKGGNN